MKRFILYLLAFLGFGLQSNLTAQKVSIIPEPLETRYGSGLFLFHPDSTLWTSHKSLESDVTVFIQEVQQTSGLKLSSKVATKAPTSGCFISLDQKYNADEYTLDITTSGITIKGGSGAGVLYALETLRQIVSLANKNSAGALELPVVSIKDKPRFSWRGMHLDVSRHFMPVSFVKKYIDYLALYKLNIFHWHLTDDQGWRIEIKKYPKLTSIGAWRNGTLIGHYNDNIPPKFDSVRYGGFYTQAEIKEVIEYAAKKHITIVPEIELPGHASAAVAAYPELSCAGKQIEVIKNWGVFEDVFCPKPHTMKFLQDVLSEVIALFPSKYIHIGGDECPKKAWKECKHCQALIKSKKLKNEDELQSYVIKEIEKFVNKKGRQIIGWDEILEGGLAPNAAVMSWRGTEGGIHAAKEHHKVVMSPTSHCYFDYYQSQSPNEPLAIGGYLPLEKVYSYEPLPTELTKEQQQYIWGAQGNIWTEYLPTPEKVEYMLLPRLLALAEFVWSAPEKKNFASFVKKVQQHFTVLDLMKANYAKSLYDNTINVLESDQTSSVKIGFQTYAPEAAIYYSLDGSIPDQNSLRYTVPISITGKTTVQSVCIDAKGRKGSVQAQQFFVNHATGKPITLISQPDPKYNTGGGRTLNDGLTGDKRFKGSQWLGYNGKDCEFVVDLQQALPYSSVKVGWYVGERAWIYPPAAVQVSISLDNTTFVPLDAKIQRTDTPNGRGEISFSGTGSTPYRYVKVKVVNAGKIPEAKPGAGNPAWLMVDEVIVE